MEIRPMRIAEQGQLAEIYLKARQVSFPWVQDPQLADFKRDSMGESVIIAAIDGKIVGFASLNRLLAFVHLLFVDPDWQRMSVGHRLIEEMDKRTQRPLTLKCVIENKPALAFYKREGFEILRKNRNDVPANDTLIKQKNE